ncbi:GDSL esterase/lipase [Quillaja saponaria]|uniref:GDSL esterase/lipase n=1 Tax=Quillaja saponaria TaxID=32244 RepID=A0AAD7KNX7_QUISA|nr:GDSL esterase/lipase [Quillaja saponaria]
MEMTKLFLVLLLHLTLLSSFVLVSYSGYIPAIFTFGDSNFDAGTNRFDKNCTAQANFPPYGSNFFHQPTGRFTNGRTVADFIFLNGTQKEYPSNGLNFASAGSGVLPLTNKEMGVTPIQEQIRQFQTLIKQNKIDKNLVQNSLFLFESGSNDIFNFFLYETTTHTLSPDTYVQAMLTEVEKFVAHIYELGARRIALFSLGPVGCVPARALVPGAPLGRCYGKMNVLVKIYNMGLENLVNEILTKYPGAIGVYGAVYKLVQQFRADPKRYDFIEVSMACCGYGALGGTLQCGKEGYKICPKPNAFLFWDYFHPSEHTYHLISKALWAGKQPAIRPINLKALVNITLV